MERCLASSVVRLSRTMEDKCEGEKGRLLNLRFDVLVQAKEVVWVVLLFDGHKPGVVRPECGFNRVFSLFT